MSTEGSPLLIWVFPRQSGSFMEGTDIPTDSLILPTLIRIDHGTRNTIVINGNFASTQYKLPQTIWTPTQYAPPHGRYNLLHVHDQVNTDSTHLHAWGTFCGFCEPLLWQHEPLSQGLLSKQWELYKYKLSSYPASTQCAQYKLPCKISLNSGPTQCGSANSFRGILK